MSNSNVSISSNYQSIGYAQSIVIDNVGMVNEQLVRHDWSRRSYAAEITEKYQAFVKAIDEKDILKSNLLLDQLWSVLSKFEDASYECIQLARQTDSSKVVDLETVAMNTTHLVHKAERMLDQMTQSENLKVVQDPEKEDVSPGDSASQQGTQVSTTSSARARASARRAALQVKSKSMDQIQRMEYEMLQTQLKQRQEIERLKMNSDLQAALEEERVLTELEEGKRVNECGFQVRVNQRNDSENGTSRNGNDCSYQVPVRQQNNNKERHLDDVQQYESNGLHDVLSMQRSLIDSLMLPKVNLVQYDGDPIKYWQFRRQFDSCIGQAAVDDVTKLNRLLACCIGKASQVISPCVYMHPADGYRTALRLLEERFGNKYLISEKWISSVTRGPQLKPNDSSGLQNFTDELKSCVETLKAMDMLQEMDSRVTMSNLIQRLPFYVQSRWRKMAVEILEITGQYPHISNLVQFLEKVCREINDPVFGYSQQSVSTSLKQGTEKNIRTFVQSKETSFNVQSASSEGQQGITEKCCVCCEIHGLQDCKKFLDMSSEERFHVVQENKLCFNCMKSRHRAKWCKISSCDCGRKHASLLHAAFAEYKKEVENASSFKKDVTASNTGNVAERSCAAAESKKEVALPIVPVIIQANGKSVRTNALLDPGGSRTFCDVQLIEELSLKGEKLSVNLDTLHGSKYIEGTEVSFEVQGTDKQARPVFLNRVFAMKIPDLRNRVKDVSQWEHLRQIELPGNGPVRLLVGQDYPFLLRPLEVRYGDCHEPYAVKTMLGWIINGPVGDSENGTTTVSAFVYETGEDVQLSRQVEQFWKVDTCGVSDDRQMSLEDRQVLKLWDDSTRLINGHYEMPIPLRNIPPDLSDNFVLAEGRLRQLTRRLKRDPAVFKRYDAEIQDLLKKGHAEKVNDVSRNSRVSGNYSSVWYLPHHNVRNARKPEKFRIVFDCAATFKEKSLNKACMQGPDLANNLLGVLLRFREKPVAVMGDVQSMFLQVKVSPECRDMMRFIWWKNGDVSEDIQIYRMTSHLFGGTWSPSCATYALRRTADDNKNDYSQEVTKAVYDAFYVDDCLLSTQTEDEAITMVNELSDLLNKGGFHLRKWVSNKEDVLSTIPVEDRGQSVKSLNHDSCLLPERVLGMVWDTKRDCLSVQIATDQSETQATKRGLLSTMSSVYDPLGVLAPYVLVAKLIFQDECRLGKAWDSRLDPANERRWQRWLNELPRLKDISIERCVTSAEDCSSAELHHFCDGSQKAYGVVTYVRTQDSAGGIRCSFLLAKSKLAPMKGMTVPRLELQAASLAVQIDSVLHRELKLNLRTSTFWSDSMIVLHYIRNTTKRFKTFVANRLSTIHEGSTWDQWRYIPSEENPADDASRGMDAHQMLTHHRWLQGPVFLHQDESTWNTFDISQTEHCKEELEVKKETKSHAAVVVDDGLEKMLKRYSSWFKLKKAVAWLLRFKLWIQCRKQVKFDRHITASEIRHAETSIVKFVQAKNYTEEVAVLKAKKAIPSSSSIFRLEPYLAEDGLLRVTGRLQFAPVKDLAKHPAIITPDHHVAQIIIRDIHAENGHSGREHTMAEMRQKFWIPKCRSLVDKVLRSCVICRRRRAEPMTQQMASLPEDRVTPEKPPFSAVGIDCFGPFIVKKGRKQEKKYGCIFTCLSIRAVHIEKLDSLEADAFINALIRFSARRGTPEEIRSDNGTNFKGAERELRSSMKRMQKDLSVQKHIQQKEIQWSFNPPFASHMGGVWERQIRTIKKIFAAVIGSQVLDEERLVTLFCEAESIINSRPLTVVSEDPKDFSPLTPNDLLLLRKTSQVPLGNFVTQDRFQRRWRHVQFLADQFWKRWIKEYLPKLQLRQKWLNIKENLKTDDIVLVIDETSPRKIWPLGRVLSTKTSHDGLVRSATVQTASGVLCRPICKLCYLEVN